MGVLRDDEKQLLLDMVRDIFLEHNISGNFLDVSALSMIKKILERQYDISNILEWEEISRFLLMLRQYFLLRKVWILNNYRDFFSLYNKLLSSV